MRVETVIKNIKKDLIESDCFFENEVNTIIEIIRKRLKRYDTTNKSKKKSKKPVVIKDSWFVP